MPVKQVLLLFDLYFELARAAVRGVRTYFGADDPVAIRISSPTLATAGSCRLLRSWAPDAVIGYFTQEQADRIATLNIPTVNIGSSVERSPGPRFPCVRADEVATARLAVEHLRSTGLRDVAYAGAIRHPASAAREAAFDAECRAAGLRRHPPAYLDYTVHDARALLHRDAAIRKWLTALPRPVGIFCFFDAFGLELVEVCRLAGWRVPEDVAILGRDDDPVYCLSARPPLSSVDTHAARYGYEAARLVDQMLTGDGPVPPIVLIPPLGVVGRASTDLLAFPDSHLVAALRYIQVNFRRPIRVDDILDNLVISRRSLELKFERHLRRSPHEEIHRLRVREAQRLLEETALPLADVARRSGLGTVKRLCTVFRAEVGSTPLQYRARKSSLGGKAR